MRRLFISHSSRDDGFVREIRQALAEHGVDAWIDSRELLPGGLLDPAIARAIDAASGLAVVVSPDSLQSRWVGKERRRALEVQRARGRDAYPVIPLSLDGTKLGVLEEYFDGEPIYVPMSSAAGGVDGCDAHPHPTRHRAPRGRRVRLHRPPCECASAGRGGRGVGRAVLRGAAGCREAGAAPARDRLHARDLQSVG